MTGEFRIKTKLPPYAVYAIFSGGFIIAALLLSLFAVPEGAFMIIKGGIGDKQSLVNLTLVTLAVCAINLAASWGIYKKDRVASHVLGALAAVLPAIILLKVAAVIFAV